MDESINEDSLERSSKPSPVAELLSVAERHFKIGEYPQALAVTDQALQMEIPRNAFRPSQLLLLGPSPAT